MAWPTARLSDVREGLGAWLRLCRQRQELTLPMLSARCGVPVTTLSRLERQGQGGVDSVLRVLHALGLLDEVDQALREKLLLASLPRSLHEVEAPPVRRQRVRRKKSVGAGR
jgi:transcriptional regulator with XRE-family HTH domain